MRRFTSGCLCTLVACGTLIAASLAQAQAPPDCQCRDPNGQPRQLGTVECVTITGRDWLVRCEMSSNTPYWNRLQDKSGCPLA